MPPPEVSDAQLIARALVGDDRHAFTELVRRHQSTVRACLRKLTAGNHALADDLAQETFCSWRNLKSFRQESTFSTWLYRIATNAGWPTRGGREELLGGRGHRRRG
jgi:RNA polymerase sigma-70 factor (ECF subfamily)